MCVVIPFRRSLLFNNKMTAVVDGFPTITRAIDENTKERRETRGGGGGGRVRR